jgi:hypothetical protein
MEDEDVETGQTHSAGAATYNRDGYYIPQQQHYPTPEVQTYSHITKKPTASFQLNVPSFLLSILFTIVPLALLSININSTFLKIVYAIPVLLWLLVFMLQSIVFGWVLVFDEGKIVPSYGYKLLSSTAAPKYKDSDDESTAVPVPSPSSMDAIALPRKLSIARVLDLIVAAMFTFSAVLLLFWVLDSSANRDSQLTGLSETSPWLSWVRTMQHSSSLVALIGGASDVITKSAGARLFECFVRLYSIMLLILSVAIAGAIVMVRVQEYKTLARRDALLSIRQVAPRSEYQYSGTSMTASNHHSSTARKRPPPASHTQPVVYYQQPIAPQQPQHLSDRFQQVVSYDAPSLTDVVLQNS